MTVRSSLVKDESDQIDDELERKGELLADSVQAADVSRTSWSHMMAQIICGTVTPWQPQLAWGGGGRRTWLKQAGLHRKVQLYPEGTNVLLHIILRKIHILAVCAKLTKCAPRTSNHVQQYIVLGVAALASMLLQIFLLKKSQRIYSVG